MIKKELSKKIENGGLILNPSNEKSILELKREEIIKIFEEKGIILFRNFKIEKEDIIKFTDKFTHSYANDANRRMFRFKNNNIRNVDTGKVEIFLHSEASYSPSWPEIVWFYCNKPPLKNGQTTVCDGNSVFNKFDYELKKFFLSNEIVYNLKIPFGKLGIKKNSKEKNLKPWYIECPGIKDCFLNTSNNEILFKLKRYAISETRKPYKMSFCNHVQIPLESDDQLISIKLENGKKIPKKILDKVKKITNKLTIEIDWHKKDLIMIDNRRLMHGRRKIFTGDNERDIVNIQTLKANFGYGSTTRA